MPPKPKPRTEQRLQALLGLAALLAPRARGLPLELAQASRDPEAYLQAHAERLEERDIDEPEDDLPWVALIDGLIAGRACFEIDWKTDAENLAWAVGKIAGAPRRAFGWMKADPELEDRSTWELLELTGSHLADHGLQLASLDMGADNYCLVLCPAARAPELVRLAKAAGWGDADLFTGSALAAARRERLARSKRDAREEAREAARPQPVWVPYGKGPETRLLRAAAKAFDSAFEAPGAKHYVNHYVPDAKATQAGVRRELAAWRAEGFRRLTRAQLAAQPHAEVAYLGWVGPFPEDARYFLEGRELVQAVAWRGATVWQTRGRLGRSFAELQNVRHFRTDAAAREHFEALVAGWKPHFPEVSRAKVLARYPRGPARRG